MTTAPSNPTRPTWHQSGGAFLLHLISRTFMTIDPQLDLQVRTLLDQADSDPECSVFEGLCRLGLTDGFAIDIRGLSPEAADRLEERFS